MGNPNRAPLPEYGMSDWKRRQLKSGKGSQTPGKTKQASCQADAQKRFFACNPKARKDPAYPRWQAKFAAMNGVKQPGKK